MKLELQSDSNAANHLARVLRADDSAARDESFERFLFKVRDELVEFNRELAKTESGLSADQVFERFAQALSTSYGFDLRLYKATIMEEGPNIGSPRAVAPAKSAAASAAAS